MTVFIVPNLTKPNALEVAQRACEILTSEGVKVLGCDTLSKTNLPIEFAQMQEALAACDIVLCIGGDGTILNLARHVTEHQKPLLGLNIGRLGFLTAIEADELHRLRLLPKGEYLVEHRSVLQAMRMSEPDKLSLALNDVVLFKHAPEKSISLNIYCDDILVSSFRGDGVVIATPTGSTAYSMSAGGPILDAKLEGIIVTQICAHIVQTPPLVFSADRVLRVVLTGTEEERVFITCDGHKHTVLAKEEEVVIRQADTTVPLVQFNDAQQLKSIDKKLKGR